MWIDWGWIMGVGMSNDELMRGCGTEEELWEWVNRHVGIAVPRMAVCAEHQAPFEYLKAAYFEPARDLVVWAPRGGGKTFLAAVATVLDLLHKPGCGVRILGGSFDQSLRMWEHLEPMMMELAEGQIRGRATAKRLELLNGASAAVLPQTQRAVRGLRIQKLRCDEVEMFNPRVWEAAQFVTKSMRKATKVVEVEGATKGVIEAISTLHSPFGLMQRIVDEAQEAGRRVIRWCMLDVLERCPGERECGRCPLEEDCRGVAKTRCEGYVSIDDAIAMKRRVSQTAWESEMLCRRPSTELSVYPAFDPLIHVKETVESAAVSRLTASIDFGYRAFVCLWIRRYEDGIVHVIDERVKQSVDLHQHIAYLKGRPWGDFSHITCDPAGDAVNAQTAISDIGVLRAAGFAVRYRTSRITEGLELVRAALRPAAGPAKLFIHPRCVKLIQSLRCYHYRNLHDETPEKDHINDHAADALRYHFVNHAVSGVVRVRSY